MANALVTGTNRGIGLELSKQLSAKGVRVFAVCRKASRELEQSGAEIFSGIDVTDANAQASLRERLGNTKLDLLLHNAGVLTADSLESFDLNEVRRQIEINALAPLALTRALANQLATNAKIAIITSRMGSVADNTSGGYYGYRMSKAAVNMAAKSLSVDFARRGIAVGLIHPGYVKTDMTGERGDISPKDAAARILQRIDGLSVKNSGTFWHANGDELPW